VAHGALINDRDERVVLVRLEAVEAGLHVPGALAELGRLPAQDAARHQLAVVVADARPGKLGPLSNLSDAGLPAGEEVDPEPRHGKRPRRDGHAGPPG